MRNISLWNQAAVGRIAWHIHTLQESLWVKWVHGVYTKGGQWDIFNAPATASWTIGKLCAVTMILRQWICSSTYSITEVYESILVTTPKVRWRYLVRNRISIPKSRFICWLAARQGLKTKDKLCQLGVAADDLCPLCGLYTESHQHLFFNCSFSRKCVEEVKTWIGITFKPITHMDFRKQRLSQLEQQTFTAIFACTIYYIWKCRNEAVWYGFVRPPGCVLSMIKRDIRQRCQTLGLRGVTGS